ncbi:MAG: hypothetical protein ACR2PZ_01610 [Pseudomonadales bacterium]
MSKAEPIIGQNGVAIETYDYDGSGYRSYEIYQRERVGQSTEKINGAQLASAEFAANPYPLLTILRENYPCYRDWINNCYWITRYDDVTSIFADDANFETRTKRWFYGLTDFGNDLGQTLPVQWAWANSMDKHAAAVAETLIADFGDRGAADLALEFAARYPLLMLGKQLQLPDADLDQFALLYWQAQNGVSWRGQAQVEGKAALQKLVDYFTPLMTQAHGDDSLIGAVVEAGGNARDLVATLLEADHETLHGALANLWMLLLTHPEALDSVKRDRLALKIAYLESLRHSPAVITAKRFAKQEVERFGRLIPKGGLMRLSALAANRDPRLFNDADTFVANRRDICHREARGQYRADGLPTAITFGLGQPSKHPAIPEDRPRSRYAVTRDTVVTASQTLMAALPSLRLQPGFEPTLKSLRIGDLYTCWNLPIQFDR